jgi:NAD(P)H-dependent FMN reductase
MQPSAPVLTVILASTRPGRVGAPIADWFVGAATAHSGFEVSLVDLAGLGLPFLDEPNHPRLRQYVHDHTKAWSAVVEASDAFVFVMPEYNHGFTAPLKNAIDFLFTEWAHKPVGFVSYGGVSGGTRAVQLLKPVLSGLQMMPTQAAVYLPFVRAMLDDEDRFVPNEEVEASAKLMLDELRITSGALSTVRSG